MATKTKAQRLEDICDRFREIYMELDEFVSEAEESRDNQADTNLSNTERFQRLDEACDTLTDARDSIESALSDLEGVEF